MGIDKVVELMAVQDQDLTAPAFQHKFILHRHPQEMRNDFRRSIMIAGDPNYFQLVGELPQQRQYLPVVLVKATKIERIKHITIQDESRRFEPPIAQVFEQSTYLLRLAVVTPQMQVREHQCVEHSCSIRQDRPTRPSLMKIALKCVTLE